MKTPKQWVTELGIEPYEDKDKQTYRLSLDEIQQIQLDALWQAREVCKDQSWLRVNRLMNDFRAAANNE